MSAFFFAIRPVLTAARGQIDMIYSLDISIPLTASGTGINLLRTWSGGALCSALATGCRVLERCCRFLPNAETVLERMVGHVVAVDTRDLVNINLEKSNQRMFFDVSQ